MTLTTESIIDLLNRRIGLNIESVGSSAIEYAVRVRMTSTGAHSPEEYWRQFNSNPAEIQSLIEAVIVPETWFFRHAETFEEMVRFVQEEWSPLHRDDALKILSCPCSTGEEPYTIVMALLDAGFPLQRLHVDAVDISRHSLQHARDGIYRPYSFRNQDQQLRQRYFTHQDNVYQLKKFVRASVHFYQGNALELGQLSGPGKYDIIFCRNMLIYLDRKAQETVAANLDFCLQPQGRLFSTPAEHSIFVAAGFRGAGNPRASCFQKRSRGDSAPVARPAPRAASAPVVKTATPRPRVSVPKVMTPSVPKPAVTPAVALDVAPPPVKSDPLDRVSALANSGRLQEAGALCEQHMQENGETIRALYLMGLVRDAMQEAVRAEKLYRKVLYLDPGHVEALLHLALLRQAAGDEAQAKQLRERARRAQERDR